MGIALLWEASQCGELHWWWSTLLSQSKYYKREKTLAITLHKNDLYCQGYYLLCPFCIADRDRRGQDWPKTQTLEVYHVGVMVTKMGKRSTMAKVVTTTMLMRMRMRSLLAESTRRETRKWLLLLYLEVMCQLQHACPWPSKRKCKRCSSDWDSVWWWLRSSGKPRNRFTMDFSKPLWWGHYCNMWCN